MMENGEVLVEQIHRVLESFKDRNILEFLPLAAAGGRAGRSRTAGTAWGVTSTMASTRYSMDNTRDTILQCEVPGARLYIL